MKRTMENAPDWVKNLLSEYGVPVLDRWYHCPIEGVRAIAQAYDWGFMILDTRSLSIYTDFDKLQRFFNRYGSAAWELEGWKDGNGKLRISTIYLINLIANLL